MYNYALVDLFWSVEGIVNAALQNPDSKIYVSQGIVKRIKSKGVVDDNGDGTFDVLIDCKGKEVVLGFNDLAHLKDINCHCYSLAFIDKLSIGRYESPEESTKILIVARND